MIQEIGCLLKGNLHLHFQMNQTFRTHIQFFEVAAFRIEFTLSFRKVTQKLIESFFFSLQNMFNVYGDERRALLWWYWVVTIWQIVMVTSPQYWEPVGRELKYQITKCRNIRLPTLHCTHMPLTSPRCETFSSLYNPGLCLSFDGHWSEVLRFPSFRRSSQSSLGQVNILTQEENVATSSEVTHNHFTVQCQYFQWVFNDQFKSIAYKAFISVASLDAVALFCSDCSAALAAVSAAVHQGRRRGLRSSYTRDKTFKLLSPVTDLSN